MKQIPGGICAAKGFSAAGLRAGIKPTSPADKNDLGLIVSSVPCAAAGVFTTNRVKAAPVWLDKEQLANGTAQVVIANSSIANACAPEGEETCRREMPETAGEMLSYLSSGNIKGVKEKTAAKIQRLDCADHTARGGPPRRNHNLTGSLTSGAVCGHLSTNYPRGRFSLLKVWSNSCYNMLKSRNTITLSA